MTSSSARPRSVSRSQTSHRSPQDELLRAQAGRPARALRGEGRDYAEIEKTIASHFDFAADPKAALAHLRDLAALGIDHVLLSPPGPWEDASLDALISMLPDIHALEP